ncbi:pirin family protein [Microbacterium sp. A93]|uniref:pirin family protein n=1 Tax=Microbacterium sp. A93 TaxID=3450716 RepID=UPI003F43C082
MSNTETDPQETICRNEPGPSPRSDSSSGSGSGSSPRFTDGLSDGVDPRAGAAGTVELLEPRAVPLGGPRAMTVKRTLPQRARSLIGAWCFLDFYGPDDVSATGGMAVPRHPHTGLATVSWLFTGRVDHIDSAGNWATVRPGEVNLMNAGAGITHSEFSTADTTVLHGVQLWYAFPEHARFSPPSLDAHRPETVAGPGYTARVFLGSLLGSTSPVTTHLPLTGVELLLEPGASLEIEVPADHEHGLLQVSGAIWLDGVQIPEDHLGFVGPGRTRITVTAGEEPVTALLIGGEPLNEQIIMWWNFVGRTHEEIVAWRAAYQAEMGFEVPGDGSPLAGTGPSGEEPLGAPVSGALLDRSIGSTYRDGRAFPQYGDFPSGTPAPLPAPVLPTIRMKPRVNPPAR